MKERDVFCTCLKHLWNHRSFVVICDEQSGINVVLTCFPFSILVIKICRARMENKDAGRIFVDITLSDLMMYCS